MTPPDRFKSARFDTYNPESPSQKQALSTVRRFVEACRRTPTVTDRLKGLFGLGIDPRPSGLYLVGPAGTGKTHLLAAAYYALTPDVPCAFLHSSTLFRSTEPPSQLGREIARHHEVCCLDEVEIDDPANEMRLVGLMKTLSARGIPLLATSNVEPENFMSAELLQVVGADYRRSKELRRDGHGWIGPPELTRAAMKAALENANGTTKWMTFADLREATTELSHTKLMDALRALEHAFVEGVQIENTDDALRLLRLVDSLYLDEEAPALYFTALRRPEDWFSPDAHSGVAGSVAEKFTRTVSRLHAMCTVHVVESEDARSSGVPSS